MAVLREKRRRPGPKGPSKELIAAVLEIKRLNPRFGQHFAMNGTKSATKRIDERFFLELT
jgi:hypothetical protein